MTTGTRWMPDLGLGVEFTTSAETLTARVVVPLRLLAADQFLSEQMLRTVLDMLATMGQEMDGARPETAEVRLDEFGLLGTRKVFTVTARRGTNPVDRAFYDWGPVLDLGSLDPLRIARIEVDATGVRHYNADGMLTMEVTNPEPEPAEDSVRQAIVRGRARAALDRMDRRSRFPLWPLVAVATLAAVITGIVLLTQWNTRHHNRQVDAAIAACTNGGGTYLYGDSQLVRLSHTESGYPNYDRTGTPKAYTAHIDYVVTDVPHTDGGKCLTPEDTVAGR